MNERVNDKINEVEKNIDFLSEIIPESLENYLADREKRMACERVSEIIIEAVTDISFLVFKEELIKDKNLVVPKSDSDVFEILARRKIISQILSRKLIEAKGMRNHLAHEYEDIDDKIVFNAISNELPNDTREFIKEVLKYYS
ncbi:MAG: DUF86 domain-containing protein [Nanoarchaeota archaeon]